MMKYSDRLKLFAVPMLGMGMFGFICFIGTQLEFWSQTFGTFFGAFIGFWVSWAVFVAMRDETPELLK